MVNPYSAGTFTLQEAPNFAWRTNGFTFSRKPRAQNVASLNLPDARFGGCNVVLGSHAAFRGARSADFAAGSPNCLSTRLNIV